MQELLKGFCSNLDLQFFHCLDDVFDMNFVGLAGWQSFYFFLITSFLIFYIPSFWKYTAHVIIVTWNTTKTRICCMTTTMFINPDFRVLCNQPISSWQSLKAEYWFFFQMLKTEFFWLITNLFHQSWISYCTCAIASNYFSKGNCNTKPIFKIQTSS